MHRAIMQAKRAVEGRAAAAGAGEAPLVAVALDGAEDLVAVAPLEADRLHTGLQCHQG